MNNPNPFLPKGSLLEQQSLRRSRLKIAVFCVLLVSVTGLVAMLIQGCKRQSPTDLNPPPPPDQNSFAMDTNAPALDATNTAAMLPPELSTNPPAVAQPLPPMEPVVAPVAPAVPAAGSEYVVVKGDSLAKIAKKNGVSLKALEEANPGVLPTKLKIGQKLVLPAGGKTSADSTASAAVAGESTTTTYIVKSGDTLTKIARAHHVTVKAIQAANGLSTTKISVGKKLKIPAKAGKAAAAPVTPAPAAEPASAPALPPMSAPAPAPSAPANQ